MSMERRGGLTKRIERKAMFSRLFGAVVTLLMIASAPHTVAEVCEDAEILGTSLITNVCWDCMFPLKIAGVTLAAGDRSNPPESTLVIHAVGPSQGGGCACTRRRTGYALELSKRIALSRTCRGDPSENGAARFNLQNTSL